MILKHAEPAPELKKRINKVISKELIEYSKSDCMFIVQNPDELAGFVSGGGQNFSAQSGFTVC